MTNRKRVKILDSMIKEAEEDFEESRKSAGEIGARFTNLAAGCLGTLLSVRNKLELK